jgi:NADPH-dependent ferric siderophore reductase
MLTSSDTLVAPETAVPDSRPAYRPFRVRVRRVTPLSEHFVRVTFTGDDLDTFGTLGLDQRINLVFPLDGIGISDCGWDDAQPMADGHWYSKWRALPNEVRNPLRVYTVRAIRPLERELDVDFVVHGDGPAARWLAAVRVGAEIIVIGPDALSSMSTAGSDWHPGAARNLLLVGDATAAPAIASILESLPPERAAHAIIEIPDAADRFEVQHSSRVTVDWISRDDDVPGGRLLPAVRAWVAERPEVVGSTLAASAQTVVESTDPDAILWDVPEAPEGASLYAWVAGEAGAITSIRRYLVRDVGIDRGQVAFMGYWRNGRSND